DGEEEPSEDASGPLRAPRHRARRSAERRSGPAVTAPGRAAHEPRRTARGSAQRITRADPRAVHAVGRAAPAIGRAIELIVRALSRGGRLVFVGAGTRGRARGGSG